MLIFWTKWSLDTIAALCIIGSAYYGNKSELAKADERYQEALKLLGISRRINTFVIISFVLVIILDFI